MICCNNLAAIWLDTLSTVHPSKVRKVTFNHGHHLHHHWLCSRIGNKDLVTSRCWWTNATAVDWCNLIEPEEGGVKPMRSIIRTESLNHLCRTDEVRSFASWGGGSGRSHQPKVATAGRLATGDRRSSWFASRIAGKSGRSSDSLLLPLCFSVSVSLCFLDADWIEPSRRAQVPPPRDVNCSGNRPTNPALQCSIITVLSPGSLSLNRIAVSQMGSGCCFFYLFIYFFLHHGKRSF